ncbi:MAG: tetratricopeptide repeat protein [Myxococcota bacterium]|nr:tetratricopeptide repeat protein [Myxococcota bacterium]
MVGLFEQGLEAYRDGRFEEAAELFGRAHAIEPVPDLSYNLARALENAGRHEEAAAAYRRYLDERRDAPDRRGIEERIRGLEERAREAQRLARERERLETERVRLARARALDTERGPDDPGAWPWLVAGSGAAAMIAGGITGALAQSTHERASSRDISQEESDALESEASALATATNALLIGGGALLAAGATWGIVALALRNGAGAQRDAATITLLPLPGGLSASGRF